MECLAEHVGKAATENTDLGLRPSTVKESAGRPTCVFTLRALTFLEGRRKKAGYATGVASFRRKHESRALGSHLRRPHFEHPSSLLVQPTIGMSLLALESSEGAVAGRLLLGKTSRPRRRITADPNQVTA